MLEFGSKSKKYHEEVLKLLTTLISIKFSLKKRNYFHINILLKKKEGIFYKIMKI